MTYKKKITILSGIVAALALVYVLSLIFDPERMGSRSDAYSWLDPAQIDRISGIIITGAPSPDGTEAITLARNGGRWFVSRNGRDYPARQTRVEDFIAALGKRAPYPVRSSSAASHGRLSLTEDMAVRVTVAAGAGLPLLSLLIGQEDITGQNVYLRKQGQNEVRSGQDIFTTYTAGTITSWYNLRLFPETETGRLNAEDVQRLTVYPPAGEGGNVPPYIFTRKGKEWTFNFELAEPDIEAVNSYIRDILNTSGDDFTDLVNTSDSMFNYSRIALDLGDGSIRTVRLGPPVDDNGRHFAVVSGSDWVYSLPGWTSRRLLVDAGNFEKD
jgi:hypothetical protein